MEGAGFRDRTPSFTDAGCEILGISFDTPEENKAFAVDESYPYRLLSDVDRTTGEAYGTKRAEDDQFNEWARRVSFLIDPERRVRRVYVVRDVKTHPQEVLDDLTSLK